MSAAAAAPAEEAAPKKGKKKLIIIGAAAAVLLLAAGGAAFMLMKKPAAEEDGEEAPTSQTEKTDTPPRDPKLVPTFVALETFTVNLADRNAERYAQVGVTLEVTDPKMGDQIKAYMPVIRNNILMALADRTSAELLAREGKTQLAEKIRRETARALGYDVDKLARDDAASGEAAGKKRKKKAEPAMPIAAVHFSTFIIQ